MIPPVLSIVTGTVNRPESFRRLAKSVIEHTDVRFELLVADASDKPVKFNHFAVRIIPEPKRLGYVKAYNSAFRECKGEWVLFLNDDAEVCPGYASEAIKFMREYQRIGLGALPYSENGGPFRVNSAWGSVYANFGILKRSLGDQVGWFDDDLEMYGSDNSLALKVLQANLGIAAIPNARVIHHSVQDEVRVENQQSRMSDNFKLQRKYHINDGTGWIKRAYERHKVSGDTLVWSHGVNPEKVSR